MKNILRIFIALWYLLGWVSHFYLGIFSPATYAVFGSTALFPWVENLWQAIVLPHITLCALILAVFEIVVGVLLVSKGKWVRVGLVLSIFFNLCLVLLGLGMPAANGLHDFLMNRLPNLVFIGLQLPLFRGDFPRSIPESIKFKFTQKAA